jgi:hypothetical protein
LADINSIQKWLWVLRAKAIKYPIPEDKVNITSSWNILNYQWYAGWLFLWTLWISGWWLDPLTQEYYTVTTNVSRTKYQLLSYFENEDNVKKEVSWMLDTYAVDSDRYIQLSWDKLWVILNNTTKEPLQKDWIDIDISQTTSTYEAHLSNNEVITWNNVSLWTLYSKSSCNRLKEFNPTLPDGKYMIDPLADGNEFEVLCDMTTDWGWWTLYSGKNIHELPTKWFLEVYPEKLNIKFKEIRWNYRSPLWLELPLIYNLYNQEEGRILLSWGQWIDSDKWRNMDNHYSTSVDFSNAFNLWNLNNSWVSELDFRQAVIDDNMHYMVAWKNQTTNEDYIIMWTAFSYSKTNINKYLWFSASPYNTTYRIWDETFTPISSYVDWNDDRSIAIWIK